ncbi:type II toxin-antitoxin system PemK/MazF family toxin [Georgenia faecalis]|uniref:Type II toxin-antitoxin system PemK/MazF family toxin n=1 Tax=Georgenia faecalis TaxID=2483799 RepID=A0ABV9D9A6_9MICO|nr:type II toxin-antitoxin system PemK/MazF family toxin [Georgenia faecalis]
MSPTLRRLLRAVRSTASSALRGRAGAARTGGTAGAPTPTRPRRPTPATPGRPSRPGSPASATPPEQAPAGTRGAGEYDVARLGLPDLSYRPEADDQPDPGEVVWAWVPFEEDPSRGKDRPVLVVAQEGAGLVGLPMTSRDHDRDAADEARRGRHWLDVGSGAWDAQGRESEVRLDRLLWLDPAAVRREGAGLDRERFAEVVAALRRLHA